MWKTSFFNILNEYKNVQAILIRSYKLHNVQTSSLFLIWPFYNRQVKQHHIEINDNRHLAHLQQQKRNPTHTNSVSFQKNPNPTPSPESKHYTRAIPPINSSATGRRASDGDEEGAYK